MLCFCLLGRGREGKEVGVNTKAERGTGKLPLMNVLQRTKITDILSCLSCIGRPGRQNTEIDINTDQ